MTVVNAEGKEGDVRLAFTVIARRRADEALRIVSRVNPEAFLTLEDVTQPELQAHRSSRIRK